MTDTIVRPAEPSDEDNLVYLCRMLHEENGVLKLDEDKVLEILRRGINRDGGIVGVIGETNKLRGMIILILSMFWYSSDWIVEELVNYVHPQHRRGRNAHHLIGFAKKCSDELHIPLFMGIISNERTEEKIRLYQRHLAKPRGAFFIYGEQAKAS